MDIKTLGMFVDIAHTGSFAAVARKHELDPSQISRAIAALENRLQFRLFKRSTRRLSLTEAGERYLTRIKPVIDELQFAEEEARQINQSPSGVLRITASTAFGQICLLPHLTEFYRHYTNIELELRFTDDNLDLFAEDIDLACRLAPTFQSDLVGIKLFDTHYRVCASPEYLSTAPEISHPEDLTAHKCVVFNLPSYRSRWQFVNKRAQLTEVNIPARLSVSNALALRECLRLGMGPGLIANWLVEKELDDGTLVDVFPKYRVTATDFDTGAWLLYPSRSYLPSKTRAMINFLKTKMQSI